MLIDKIEDALMHLSRYTLGKTFPDYCDLRTVIGLTADDKVRHPSLDAPYIQATLNNDYVTCFEIKGLSANSVFTRCRKALNRSRAPFSSLSGG